MQVKAKSKYHAQPERIDGIRFASRAEARRYCELKLLERAGHIRNLTLQPRFPLRVKLEGEWTPEPLPVTIGEYRADFQYDEWRLGGWMPVVEDVKGMKTALYKWKRKHVMAQYAIDIREITSR